MDIYPVKPENLWKDTDFPAGEAAPQLDGYQIPGKNGRIFSTFFQAGGKGPHAAVLICHGFPGNDCLVDVAQAFQHAGMHVMTFHYSGSWGSDGDYRLSNCIDDAESVLDYMLSHPELGISKEHIYILGHSLGGFAALHTFAARKELKSAVILSPANPCEQYKKARRDSVFEAEIDPAIAECCSWLNGAELEDLKEEVHSNFDHFEFSHLSADLTDRPMLLVAAEQDTITPIELNQKPLLDALQKVPHPALRYETLPGDHQYQSRRSAVTQMAASFLAEQTERA